MTALVLVAALLSANPTPSVGVYVPSLFFPTMEAKAQYLTELEGALSLALGVTVQAHQVSDPTALVKDPLIFVDSPSQPTAGAVPVLQAYREGDEAEAMALYVAEGGRTPAKVLESGKVALFAPRPELLAALQYWVMLDEPGVAAALKRVRPMRDARTAVAALAAGETDAALVPRLPYPDLDPKLARVQEAAVVGALPLTVLSVNTKVIDAPLAKQWIGRLATASLPTVPAVIDGWRAANTGVLQALARSITSKRPRLPRVYALAPCAPLRVDLVELLPEPPRPPPLSPAIVMPEPEEAPLPDPTAPPPPAVATAPQAAQGNP